MSTGKVDERFSLPKQGDYKEARAYNSISIPKTHVHPKRLLVHHGAREDNKLLHTQLLHQAPFLDAQK